MIIFIMNRICMCNFKQNYKTHLLFILLSLSHIDLLYHTSHLHFAYVTFNNVYRILRFYSRTCLSEVEHLPTFLPHIYMFSFVAHAASQHPSEMMLTGVGSEFSLTLHFLGFASATPCLSKYTLLCETLCDSV